MPRFMRILFWIALCFAVIMAILPHPPQLPGGPNDKFQHMLAFGVLTVLGTLGYPKANPVKIACTLIAVGAGIEVLQMIPFLNRQAEWMDLFADSFAIVVTLMAMMWLRRVGNPWMRQFFVRS